MSKVGLDWYKREPVAYLGDVQGLSAKQHAVYSVIIELLYVHGGVISNDPKWIAGWISDMGAASVRRALAELEANPKITLTITEAEISQKRAKNEAKTKEKLRETARKSGRKGGEKSAERRAAAKENNSIAEATASGEIQAEKRREDTDTNVSGASAPPIDFAKAIFEHGVRFLREHGSSEDAARKLIGKWRKSYTDTDIYAAFKAASKAGVTDPKSYIAATLGGQHGKSSGQSDRLQRTLAVAARGTSAQDWG